MDQIDLIPLTPDNLRAACAIQHTIFPLYNADRNYLDSLQGRIDAQYWIVGCGEEMVGICGIYREPFDPDDAWLGWFGFLPPFRRKGYGTRVIARFEDEARRRHCRLVRLFTDADNLPARRFYEACGYTGEPYTCREDPVSTEYALWIYSKSLDADTPCPPWGDRNLHLGEQMRSQRERIFETTENQSSISYMKPIDTPNAPAAIGPYSQAVNSGSGIVFVSGQLPIDPATGSFPEGGVKEQTRQSLLNAAAILEAAGLDLSHVVKTTVFLADMADFAAMNEVYAQFFSAPFPARSAVAVKDLPRGAKVEIECIATN